MLKCISQDDGINLLEDIHAGSCGNHAASRTLVRKAFRGGFYWPTAVVDAEKLIRHCKGCQFFAKWTYVPAHEIQTIPSSWSFACWGLDMIGPFKPAHGNFKFVFVLIDKFSKWIEYVPLVKATSEKAVEFLNQIIHRFGVPNSIITDLGTQFTGTTFWDFCDDRGNSLLFYNLFLSVTSNSQDASKIHQTPFILLNLYITIHNFFIHI